MTSTLAVKFLALLVVGRFHKLSRKHRLSQCSPHGGWCINSYLTFCFLRGIVNYQFLQLCLHRSNHCLWADLICKHLSWAACPCLCLGKVLGLIIGAHAFSTHWLVDLAVSTLAMGSRGGSKMVSHSFPCDGGPNVGAGAVQYSTNRGI